MRRIVAPEYILGVNANLVIKLATVKNAAEIVRCARDQEVARRLQYFSFFQKAPTIEEEARYLERMIVSKNDKL